MADRFGRYPVFMVTMFCQLPLFIAAIYTTHLGVLYVLVFLLGVGLIGRFTTGFVMLTEYLIKRDQAIVGTALMIGDSAATLYISLYLRFSHYANTMFWVGFLMNVISFIGCFWINESPSWLVSVGRTMEAKKIIKQVAKRNNVKDFYITDLMKEEKVYEDDNQKAKESKVEVD